MGKDEKISNTEEKSVEAWKNSIKDNISRLVRFIEEEEEMKNELEIVISNKEKSLENIVLIKWFISTYENF